ncbi:MAG: hypothetical protein Q8P86_00410 [bacterium]|nr:hypothetical protein [bacterium]
MPTAKQRINITTDPNTEAALKRIAKREGVPVATKAAEFVVIGLELEEDMALSAIADSRSSKKVKYIKHGSAWK